MNIVVARQNYWTQSLVAWYRQYLPKVFLVAEDRLAIDAWHLKAALCSGHPLGRSIGEVLLGAARPSKHALTFLEARVPGVARLDYFAAFEHNDERSYIKYCNGC